MPDELQDTPPPWQDVEAQPAFRDSDPEDKLVAFSRWHDKALTYASAQPDWQQHAADFNQSAAEIQGDLSKAAGGITPDQARVKIAQQAIEGAKEDWAAKNPPTRQLGTDILSGAAPTFVNGNPLTDLAAQPPLATDLSEIPTSDVSLAQPTTNIATPAATFGKQQERDALRPYGPDIWKAYLDARVPEADETILGNASHELINAVREARAHVAKNVASGAAFTGEALKDIADQAFGTNIATPQKEPNVEEAMNDYSRRIMNARETFSHLSPDDPNYQIVKNQIAGLEADRGNVAGEQNAKQESYVNAVQDLHNTLSNIDPEFHVDPSLKNTLSAQVGGVVGDVAPAFAPGIGTPLFLLQSGTTKWANTYDATGGDAAAADKALVEDMGINLLFMGAAHGSNSLLLKAIGDTKVPGGLSPLASLAVRGTGGSAANVAIGQAIAGAEAAKDAPEGEKYAAFAKAFNTPDGLALAQAIGFGVLGTKPIDSLRAAARETVRARTPAEKADAVKGAVTTAEVTNLNQANSPQMADAVESEADRQRAIEGRAGALREAQRPLSDRIAERQQNEAVAGQENFIGDTFSPQTEAPAAPQPPIKLSSAKAGEGDYSHTLTIAPETTVEQLEAWKAKADLSHLPPEARVAVIEQLDAAIESKKQVTAASAAPAATKEGEKIAGPALVAADGKTILVQGKIGDTHSSLMDRGMKEAGDDFKKIDAILEAQMLDDQHVFVDDKGNVLDREKAAELAVKAGQAPEGTTRLQSQNLKEAAPEVVAASKVGRANPPEGQSPLSPEDIRTGGAGAEPVLSEAEVARMNARTPEEKAAQKIKGRTEQLAAAEESGHVPTRVEALRATGDAAEGKKVQKEIAAKLAADFPPETLAEGDRETTTKNRQTGDELPSVIGADGKVRPKFTNDPTITAQQIDLGQRVTVPAELLGPDYKVNPAFTLAIDKATGEKYVLSVDTKMPNGDVVKVAGPDEFTKAYEEATAFAGKKTHKPISLEPEVLQGVKDSIDRDMKAEGIDYEPLTLGEATQFDGPSLDSALEEGETPETPESTIIPEVLHGTDVPGMTRALLSNIRELDRIGIGKPSTMKDAVGTGLRFLAKDSTIPAGYRIIAKYLLKSGIDWSQVKLTLADAPGRNHAGLYTGSSRAEKGTIAINRATGHRGGLIATLLHEAVHHATLRKLAPDYKRTRVEEQAYQNLRNIFDKAFNEAFKQEHGRLPKSNDEILEFQKGLAGKDHLYGITNLNEFVSEAITSPDFQKFLSTLEGEKGVKGKLGNLLNSIIDSLKQLFSGEKITKGSLLDNALDESYKMLKRPPETARIGKNERFMAEAKKPETPETELTRDQLEESAREKGVTDAEILTMTTGELKAAIGGPLTENPPPTSKIPDDSYGWLGPDGKFYPVDFLAHDQTALEIVNKDPKLEKEFAKLDEKGWDDPEGQLEFIHKFMVGKGFVRVAGGPGNTTTYIQGTPNRSQLRALKDAVMEKGAALVHEIGSKRRTLYDPTNAFSKAAELTHETDENGQTTHDIQVPKEASAEDLRGALDTIAKSSIPDAEKTRLQAKVAGRLETYQLDTAANEYSKLQEQIAAQPDGATAEQSARLDQLKRQMPEVVDHPEVQRSAQALGIIPGYLDVNDTLVTTYNKAKNYFATTKPANWWAAWLNAADNKAVVFTNQKVNDVRGLLREVMNRKNAAPSISAILKAGIKRSVSSLAGRTPKEMLDDRALTFVVESQNNPANLDVMRQKIKTALATPGLRKPGWTRKAGQALAAIDHAEANYGRLSVAADFYTKNMQDQVRLENTNGIATNYRKGYVPHLQEVDADYDVLFGTSSGLGGTGFKKARAHPTFADSIAAGVEPKTLSALETMENRLKRGMGVIGRQKWAEAGKGLIDPITNSPVVKDVIIDKHPQTGESQSRAPLGYQMKLFGNRQIAVHDGYAGLFDAWTKPSGLRNNALGNAALQTAGFVKHGLLLFDTFHLGRLAYYQMPLRGKATFQKGLLTLDYSDQELQNMERRGDLPRGVTSADLINRKTQFQRLVDQGLNIGGVQEALNAGFTRKLPVVGDFNKFVFEQFQRGGMAESALTEYERQRASFPELTEDEVARKVSKELNTRFGNLKKEGWLASDTMADLAQLVLLAPHWNEGLIKSEIGAVTQLGRAAKDATLGYKDPASGDRVRSARAGSLLKGSGTLLLGTLVMNQIINYITRGQPTWKNPEEGINSKISAWIPDKIGGGPGFFLNPFTLPGEITHQVMERIDHGSNAVQAVAKVAGYKLGPLGHIALTGLTQKDRFGRPLYTTEEIMKEMVSDLSPFPIFYQSGSAVLNSIGKGKVTEPIKGSIEKQAFAMGGVKLSGAPSDATRISRLAHDFMKANHAERKQEFTGSEYTNLKQAIQNNDPERAQEEFTHLLLSYPKKHIDEYFRSQVGTLFTGKGVLEARFKNSLTPEQRATYSRAIADRKSLKDAYFNMKLKETAP